MADVYDLNETRSWPRVIAEHERLAVANRGDIERRVPVG